MRAIFICLLILFHVSAFADAPSAPKLAVKSYLLLDFNSQRAIAEHLSNKRVEPASLTKVMTAYLAFQALKEGQLEADQALPVSNKAWKVEGSKMFIEPNKPVTVHELLHGLIIQSGNDAAIALAEGIAGSEETFAERMNQQASKLGMQATHYMNATGLPHPQHFTTAADLALLANALIRDFPDQYKTLYSIKEYTYNKITQPNRNRLLWLDPFVDGMKTGHTNTAGYCLIASAKREDMRLISVILGASSEATRATESQKLLNYGFQFYESKRVYAANKAISSFRVWKGSENTLEASVPADLYLSIPKGQYAQVKAKITSQQPLIAQINQGQKIGTIQFLLNDKVIDERALLATKAVPVAGLFGRMIDSIRLKFQ